MAEPPCPRGVRRESRGMVVRGACRWAPRVTTTNHRRRAWGLRVEDSRTGVRFPPPPPFFLGLRKSPEPERSGGAAGEDRRRHVRRCHSPGALLRERERLVVEARVRRVAAEESGPR